MDSKEDEEINIDFGKIKKLFKSDKKKDDKSVDEDSAKAEKDDEISIDFGKITKFFKSDKPESKENISDNDEKKDEEISLDFGRIKNLFKGEKEAANEDDITVNWSKAIDFFKKYGVIFIALIPIVLSIYVRMQAGYLLFTDDWAANSVINGIKSQIRSSIDQQYPNLPDANKNTLVDTELQKILSQNKAQIDQQVKAASQYFKSFYQDENGKNYMPDIDPYYWSRYAKNIVEHGHPGDILKNGKPFDTYQLAPVGRFVFPDMFHAYSIAYFYRFLKFFMPDLALINSMFYLPVLISALCVLLVFLIGKRIAGNIGGFFAGLMMAVNGAFLSRSLHPDNDIWVIFFPLVITWLFVITIDIKKMPKIWTISLLAGFLTGMFTRAWSGGWWYIFDFLLATVGLTFLYLILSNFSDIRKNTKVIFLNTALRNIVIFGCGYFISAAVFVSLFSSWPQFVNSFLGPLSFPSIKAPVTGSLWPNVLTTVAELNEGSVDGIINSVGGSFLFFISLTGLILSISRSNGIKRFDFFYIIGTVLFYGTYFLLRRVNFDVSVFGLMIWILLPIMLRIGISIHKNDSSYDFKLAILLSLWIVSTIFASIKGIRFTLLLAPAFSVAFGIAIAKIYIYFSRWLAKELKIHKAIGNSILIVLLLLVYVNPIRGAIGAAGSDISIINDAWYNALAAIKQDSKEDAIITSWWDFGHHFKAIADRRVTFDGTTQTSPAAHWVGKLLMTDDETLAVGIIRMLDCGHNRAYDTLFKTNNNTHKSLKIVNEIILLDSEKARKRLLGYGLNVQQTEEVLSYTHCLPPEGYFIASEDMIGKSGVWSHFGSWDFERADIWQNARKLPKEQAVDYMVKKLNYTMERAENIYFETQAITSDSEANSWIAPWPGYGGTMSCSKNDKGLYECSNGFQINLSNYDVFGIGQEGVTRPKVAAFTTENGLLKKEFNGTTMDFGITIIPINENELKGILSSKELTGSMFTRMFFMQGHGLRYFKLFNHQRGLTGTDIYTYKVDWEGKNATVVEDYANMLKEPVKKENIAEGKIPTQNNNNTNSS